jgi:hypothetical protein
MSNTSEKIQNTFQELEQDIINATHNLDGQLKETGQSLSEIAHTESHNASQYISETAEGIKNSTEEVIDKVAEKFE